MINSTYDIATDTRHTSVNFLLSGFLIALIVGLNVISVPSSGLVFLITRAIQAFQLLVVVCFVHLHFKTLNVAIPERPIRLIHYWWASLFILTLLADTIHFTIIYQWLTLWLLIMVFRLTNDANKIVLIEFIATLLSLLIYANAFLFLIFPDGLWTDTEWVGTGDPSRHLFGNYNQTGMVCLLGIMSRGITVIHHQRGYWRLLLLLAVSVATVYGMGSMTSTVGLVAITIYFLLHKLVSPLLYTVGLTIYLLLYILFFYIIVWQGFAIDNLKFATQFIENTLQKDTSFTERIYLWEEASYLIQNSMWFGYGVQSPEWMMEKIGGSGPHNFWMLNLLQGGLLLCGIFVMIVLESIINTFRNSTAKSRWALACLCIMMLMSLFETYNIICIFMVIIMLHFTLKIPDEK